MQSWDSKARGRLGHVPQGARLLSLQEPESPLWEVKWESERPSISISETPCLQMNLGKAKLGGGRSLRHCSNPQERYL